MAAAFPASVTVRPQCPACPWCPTSQDSRPGPSSPAALGMCVHCGGKAWGRREEALLTSTDHLCVGFLCSIQSAHPADPFHQQSDQDPLPHRQEDPSTSSQRPPVSPIPALLAGTAALPVQVGGHRPGCHGPRAWCGLSLPHGSAGSSLVAEEQAHFSVPQSLHQTYSQPVWAVCTDTCAPRRCQETVSWQETAEGAATVQTTEATTGAAPGHPSWRNFWLESGL